MAQKFMYVVALVNLSSPAVSRTRADNVSFEHIIITANSADEAYAKGLEWVTTHLPHGDHQPQKHDVISAA
jgi:hypothetical protein